MSPQPNLDTTLRWLYKKYLESQRDLPQTQRIGWAAWCADAGILTPYQIRAIHKHESTVGLKVGEPRIPEDNE